jgi:hypothetical protein
MSIKSFRKIDVDFRVITIKNETPFILNIAIVDPNYAPTIKKIAIGAEVTVKIHALLGVDNPTKASYLKIFSESMVEIGEPYQIRSTNNYYLVKQGGPSERSDALFVTGMYFNR